MASTSEAGLASASEPPKCLKTLAEKCLRQSTGKRYDSLSAVASIHSSHLPTSDPWGDAAFRRPLPAASPAGVPLICMADHAPATGDVPTPEPSGQIQHPFQILRREAGQESPDLVQRER